MVIVGTTTKTVTLGKAKFHCPHCNTLRTCLQQQDAQFFSIFFIPLIKQKEYPEYLRCQTCANAYSSQDLDALKTNPLTYGGDEPASLATNYLSDYERALRFALVRVMLADGDAGRTEMLHGVKVLHRSGLTSVTYDELLLYVQKVQIEGGELSEYLGPVAVQLSDAGREGFLRSALAVAAADGKPTEDELREVKMIAAVLRMPVDRMDAVIADAMDRRWIE